MKKFLLNFPLGLFLGIEISIFFFWMTQNAQATSNPSLFVGPASSALILISAVVALIGLLHSLDEQAKVRMKDRARKLGSARAFLPTALSEFCTIAELGGTLLHQITIAENRRERHFELRERFKELRLSDEIISVFRDVLEYVDDERVAARLQLLLREYQVQLARTENLDRDYSWWQDDYFRQVTVGWFYINEICGTLFDFARQKALSVNDADFSISMRPLGFGEVDSIYADEIELYIRTFQRRAIDAE